MNKKRIDVLGCKIGMIYHPNFDESLWDIGYICENLLGYSEPTVRTNLKGVGRIQASKAWNNIHREVEERDGAYYARPPAIVKFLNHTVDVGRTEFKERAISLLNDDFLVKLKNAWFAFSQ